MMVRVAVVSDNEAIVLQELTECISLWRHLARSVPQPDQIQQALQTSMRYMSLHYASLTLYVDPHWSVSYGEVPDSPVVERDITIEQTCAGKLIIASSASAAVMQARAAFLAECIATAAALVKQARDHDRLQERLAALNRNQNEFIRIVSHDLRSPLTSMRGYAEMLELGVGGELNERQRQFTEKITAGILSMTSIVENIQDAGRFDPETGFYETSRDAVDVGEVVGRVVHNQLIPAEKEDLSISIWIADDLPIINADVNMLERAVTNLVDNAIKYTPNGGAITISVSRTVDEQHGDHVRISVQDNGLGISAEDQQKLFQRHVRLARRDQKQIKGTGLGLFIVRSVAQRHGGDAWVESEPGKGSTFHISIPLTGLNLLGSPRSDQHEKP
jgi:signal transduction histidine kinase